MPDQVAALALRYGTPDELLRASPLAEDLVLLELRRCSTLHNKAIRLCWQRRQGVIDFEEAVFLAHLFRLGDAS